MKNVIVKLLGFYIEYRMHVNRMKTDFWRHIDGEWFHKPMTHEEFMKLVGGDKK